MMKERRERTGKPPTRSRELHGKVPKNRHMPCCFDAKSNVLLGTWRPARLHQRKGYTPSQKRDGKSLEGAKNSQVSRISGGQNEGVRTMLQHYKVSWRRRKRSCPSRGTSAAGASGEKQICSGKNITIAPRQA